jgi:FAD/FMN-containing dehydrogenase
MFHSLQPRDATDSRKRARGEETSNGLFEPLARVVGRGHVFLDEPTLARYRASTTGVSQTVVAIVRPASAGEVQAVVRVARALGVPIYPISKGHNWGYGEANPPRSGAIVVDLSRMNRIVAVDAELGTATVEPGVTQADLYRYLEEHRLDLLVPTHGGGPDCSLVGNALERGYGLTPHSDHFLAVRSLEAVLADGRLYRSPLVEHGGAELGSAFKWGVGPYLDGLFSQGNLGIITRMTIALAPRPETTRAFLFWLRDDGDLQLAVEQMRTMLRDYPGALGSMNLMNARRVLSMLAPYPHERAAAGGVMTDADVRTLARAYHVSDWTGFGGLYGRRSVVAAAEREIRRRLKSFASRVVFFDRRQHDLASAVARRLPFRSERLDALLSKTDEALQLLEGKPSRAALPLAYWRQRRPMRERSLDPARDGCGLIWYAPLVPIKRAIVRRYVDMVREICPRHGIEPLITLTTVTDGCFDSTVPILFDPEEPGAPARAHECYSDLVRAGQRIGVVPYRVAASQMSAVVDPSACCWQMVASIKHALDPSELIAPGRYAPA